MKLLVKTIPTIAILSIIVIVSTVGILIYSGYRSTTTNCYGGTCSTISTTSTASSASSPAGCIIGSTSSSFCHSWVYSGSLQNGTADVTYCFQGSPLGAVYCPIIVARYGSTVISNTFPNIVSQSSNQITITVIYSQMYLGLSQSNACLSSNACTLTQTTQSIPLNLVNTVSCGSYYGGSCYVYATSSFVFVPTSVGGHYAQFMLSVQGINGGDIFPVFYLIATT